MASQRVEAAIDQMHEWGSELEERLRILENGDYDVIRHTRPMGLTNLEWAELRAAMKAFFDREVELVRNAGGSTG